MVIYISLIAAFLTQTVNLDDTTVKFEIWDTAGQENILFDLLHLYQVVWFLTDNHDITA